MSTDQPEAQEQEFEIVTGSAAIEAISNAEVNQQIATAHKFPRLDIQKIQDNMKKMAAFSAESASDCFYTLERTDTRTGQKVFIYGPSVRLSEVAIICWRNMHTASRIIDVDRVNRQVTAQAVCWDLETNVRRATEFSLPIYTRGKDAVKLTSQAAIAFADRNAIFKVIPRNVWAPVFEHCMKVAGGGLEPLPLRIKRAIEFFETKHNVSVERLLAKFGYDKPEQITETDLQTLTGFKTAIKEEIATPEVLFPAVEPKRDPEPSQETGPASKETTNGEAPEEAPKRRGRPPGSKNRPADPPPSTVGADRTPTPSLRAEPEPQDNPFAETSLPEPAGTPKAEVLEFPQVDETPTLEPTEKDHQIKEIREKMAAKSISEASLLAALKMWRMDYGLPTPPERLEDFPEDRIQGLLEKWEYLSVHIPARQTAE